MTDNITYLDHDPYFDKNTPEPADDLVADTAAERTVLGALMADPRIVNQVRVRLKTNYFYEPRHSTIYDAICSVDDRGEPVDILTVGNQLQNTGAPKLRDLRLYLHELVNKVGATHTAPFYADLIREQSRRRGLHTLGTQLRALAANAEPATLDAAIDRAYEALDEAANQFGTTTHTVTSSWAPLDLDPVLQGDEVDPPPCILQRNDGPHLLYAAAIHTISGEPGSGKTWLALIAALQQLAAGAIVTMIDFEDRASRVIGRLLSLGAHPDAIRSNFRYVRPNAPVDDTNRPHLDQATTGASLVILDGVTEAMTIHGLDLNNNADIATFNNLLPRHIADHTGAAVVMIDHVVKDGEKQGRWAIGGQHKLAAIDGAAFIVKATEPFGRGKTGVARIGIAKDRPGHLEGIAYGRIVAELLIDGTDELCVRHQLRPAEEVPLDTAGNLRPTFLMERLSRYIEITPGLNQGELTQRVTGKPRALVTALDHLVSEGYVEVDRGPKNSKLYRSVEPFRQHPEE